MVKIISFLNFEIFFSIIFNFHFYEILIIMKTDEVMDNKRHNFKCENKTNLK